MKYKPSTRSKVISRRTYNRPLDPSGKTFESWEQTIDRVMRHQEWLWSRAQGKPLTGDQLVEIADLRHLMYSYKATTSGRSLWLGGTEVSKRRESTMFNCSFKRVVTVSDVVDAYWLLLQGCGVGFEPVVGCLSGFSGPVELEIIRSAKTNGDDKGFPYNIERFTEVASSNRRATIGTHWYIRVGDSAEAWAKLPGKLLANKRRCHKLTIDFSEVRPAGTRLASYGWISSGDDQVSVAVEAIVNLLNHKNSQLLTRIDILDIMNWLGTTLSSRRSAEIALVPYGDLEWVEFARAKDKYYIDNIQRAQSNNSLVFYFKPTKGQLNDIFDLMVECGGSEPGFINATTATRRAPWFKGVNPCGEILLGDGSFCNLVTIDLGKYNGHFEQLKKDIYLLARANYRQTCVDLKDGMLQPVWHELNEFLRLCGVNVTGIVRWEYQDHPLYIKMLREAAVRGAYSMADDLKLPRPQAVTTIQPSGTLSKVMDTTWGLHKPEGKYIFNWVKFSKHDPIVHECAKANYKIMEAPGSPDAMLVCFPVQYDDVEFTKVTTDKGTFFVNKEPALVQLRRYKLWMENYVQHNASITVSYSPEEIPGIIDWIIDNWDTYVGVSFMLRQDPMMTAEDLGHPYLPLEVVAEERYLEYVASLGHVRIVNSFEEIQEEACATGACPIR